MRDSFISQNRTASRSADNTIGFVSRPHPTPSTSRLLAPDAIRNSSEPSTVTDTIQFDTATPNRNEQGAQPEWRQNVDLKMENR